VCEASDAGFGAAFGYQADDSRRARIAKPRIRHPLALARAQRGRGRGTRGRDAPRREAGSGSGSGYGERPERPSRLESPVVAEVLSHVLVDARAGRKLHRARRELGTSGVEGR
jgi:hypothetical protein